MTDNYMKNRNGWDNDTRNRLEHLYLGITNINNKGVFKLQYLLPYMHKLLTGNYAGILNEEYMRQDILEGIQLFEKEAGTAFDKFKQSVETFAKATLYRIGLIKEHELSKTNLSMSEYNRRLITALKEKCCLPEKEINKLTYLIDEGETWRNKWQHITPPKDKKIHQSGCQIALGYILAVSAASRKIEFSRGGIRFISSIECELELINKYRNKQVNTLKYITVGKPFQLDCAPGEYTLHIIVPDINGTYTKDFPNINIKKDKYEIISFNPGREISDFQNFPTVLNRIGDDKLQTAWKDGYWHGKVDSASRPHDVGTYVYGKISFGGRFDHGQPIGTFIVQSSSFIYRGSVAWDKSNGIGLQEGEMEMKDGTRRKYKGKFKNFSCKFGELLIEDRRVYYGSFKEIDGQTVVTGKGTLHYKSEDRLDCLYYGEVVNGMPHGRGIYVHFNSFKKKHEMTYGDWFKGELVTREFKTLHISGNVDADLLDGEDSLDMVLAGWTTILKYAVHEPKFNVRFNFDEIIYCTPEELMTGIWNYRFEKVLQIFKGANGMLGLKTGNGKIVVPAEYDRINANLGIQNGSIRVMKGKKFGIVDNKGNFILPVAYRIYRREDRYYELDDEILPKQPSGILNSIIAAGYDYLTFCPCGGYIVSKDKKKGYLNAKGETGIPIIFHEMNHIRFKDGFMPVKIDKWKAGFVDNKGKILCLGAYRNCGEFSEGLAPVQYDSRLVQTDTEDDLHKAGTHMRWGYIDTSGKLVIPCVFDEAGPFVDGKARVVIGRTRSYRDKYHSYLEDVCLEIGKDWENSRVFRMNRMGNKVDITVRNNAMLPAFTHIEQLYKEFYFMIISNGKKGVVRYDGKVILSTVYDKIVKLERKYGGLYDMDDGRWCLLIKGTDYTLLNYLDMKSKVKLDFTYMEEVYLPGKDNCFIVSRAQRKGIISIHPSINIASDNLYKMLAPLDFEDIQYSKRKMKMSSNGRCRYLDLEEGMNDEWLDLR